MLIPRNMSNKYKTNANLKINILTSENVGQRRQYFSLEYFDALYYHHFQPNKFRISPKYFLKAIKSYNISLSRNH